MSIKNTKEKVTKQVDKTYSSIKRVIENAEHFVIATALVIVASYNYYDLTIRPVGEVEYYIRLAASITIFLKGSIEVIRFFDKQKVNK